jgi:hypothetical protein
MAAAALPSAFGKDQSMFQQILEASRNDKKGVTLFIRGQQIGGVVVKIEGDAVELRAREYSRIVVRLESIDAAALA